MGTTIVFSTFQCTILIFGFARKTFLSTIFVITKVSPSSESNLDAHNNLHSFCYGYCNHILHIGICDIDTLDLQEIYFFLQFSKQWKFIREIRQTWILIVIIFLFVIGPTIMFTSLGYAVLMLWICKKSFHSTIFLIIKVHREICQTWIPIIISIPCAIGQHNSVFHIEYKILML